MSKLVETPVTPVPKPSTDGSGSCIYDGEPGLPTRTTGGKGVQEVTYDTTSPLVGPKGK